MEGVYESQTPLWFRALLKTGCVCRPTHSPTTTTSSSSSSAQRVFKLDELDFVNTAHHPYLQPAVAQYRRIFLYCSADKSRASGLGAVGLFIVDAR